MLQFLVINKRYHVVAIKVQMLVTVAVALLRTELYLYSEEHNCTLARKIVFIPIWPSVNKSSLPYLYSSSMCTLFTGKIYKTVS